MNPFRSSRVASGMLLALALVSSGCGTTTTTPTGEVRVTNGGAFILATVRIVHGGGQASVANVAAGGVATFPHVSRGTFTATGYNSAGQPVVSAPGELSGDVANVTLDW